MGVFIGEYNVMDGRGLGPRIYRPKESVIYIYIYININVHMDKSAAFYINVN